MYGECGADRFYKIEKHLFIVTGVMNFRDTEFDRITCQIQCPFFILKGVMIHEKNNCPR